MVSRPQDGDEKTHEKCYTLNQSSMNEALRHLDDFFVDYLKPRIN